MYTGGAAGTVSYAYGPYAYGPYAYGSYQNGSQSPKPTNPPKWR